jgi:CRP-like cAMP-binding protein
MSDEIIVDPKKLIFKEGQNAGKLYLIKSGEILCLKSSKDRLIPVFKAGPQDIIGENAMIHNSQYTYSAIATERTQLIEISAVTFGQILKEAPQWLIDLTNTMISRFQSTATLIAENRAIHSSIVGENEFPSSLEVEFKKILS